MHDNVETVYNSTWVRGTEPLCLNKGSWTCRLFNDYVSSVHIRSTFNKNIFSVKSRNVELAKKSHAQIVNKSMTADCLVYSGMCHCVAWCNDTVVSEEIATCIFGVENMSSRFVHIQSYTTSQSSRLLEIYSNHIFRRFRQLLLKGVSDRYREGYFRHRQGQFRQILWTVFQTSPRVV
jgi:hypothetical protein